MHLTLAIPSLNRRSDETLPQLYLPALNQILRYGRLKKQACPTSLFYGKHLWQKSLLNQAKTFLNLPATRPAAFASPIWQQMGLHQANIISGEHLAIQDHEARQWCEQLSTFHQGEQWHFYPVRNDLWLVTMPSESDWQVIPVLDLHGRISADDRACGHDALQWLGKQTETQMWLHQHPLNAVRRAEKHPEINGLWLWQDIHGRAAAPLLATDSPWAQFFHGKKHDAPYDFAAYCALAAEHGASLSDSLIFLDELTITEQTGDVYAYQKILQSWETRWFAPLWQAVKTGRLKQLTVTTDGEHGGELLLTPQSKWAFWKAAKQFEGIW